MICLFIMFLNLIFRYLISCLWWTKKNSFAVTWYVFSYHNKETIEIWISLKERLDFYAHKCNNTKFERRSGKVKAKQSEECKYLGRVSTDCGICNILIQRIIGTDKDAASNLASRLQLIPYSCNIASMCLFCKYFRGNYCPEELSSLVPWPRKFKLRTRLANGSDYFFNNYISRKFYSNSLFTRNSCLWIYLPTFSLLIMAFNAT